MTLVTHTDHTHRDAPTTGHGAPQPPGARPLCLPVPDPLLLRGETQRRHRRRLQRADGRGQVNTKYFLRHQIFCDAMQSASELGPSAELQVCGLLPGASNEDKALVGAFFEI